MTIRFPPLNALRAFEAASRTESFTISAAELCVSQGAVSRHVAHLEEFLGVRLFERGHRGLRLTPVGAVYASEVQAIFARIEEATTSIRQRETRLELRLNLFPTIAARWLLPRLNSFHVNYPDVEVRLATSRDGPDLERREVDVRSYRGDPRQPNIGYQPLINIELVPVCSPELLGGKHSLESAAEVARFPLLSSVNRALDWLRWFAQAGANAQQADRAMQFESSALLYQAAVDGAGIALAELSLVEPELASGRLIRPHPHVLQTGETYGLAWLRAREREGAIAAFLDWISTVVTQRKFGESTDFTSPDKRIETSKADTDGAKLAYGS